VEKHSSCVHGDKSDTKCIHFSCSRHLLGSHVMQQRPFRRPVPCHLTPYSKSSSQRTSLLAFLTRLDAFICCTSINLVEILIGNCFACQSHCRLSFSIRSLRDLSLLAFPQPLMAAFFVIFFCNWHISFSQWLQLSPEPYSVTLKTESLETDTSAVCYQSVRV